MELTLLDLIFPFVSMGYLFLSACVAFVTFLRWIRRGSSGTAVLRSLFWIHETAVSQGTSPLLAGKVGCQDGDPCHTHPCHCRAV